MAAKPAPPPHTSASVARQPHTSATPRHASTPPGHSRRRRRHRHLPPAAPQTALVLDVAVVVSHPFTRKKILTLNPQATIWNRIADPRPQPPLELLHFVGLNDRRVEARHQRLPGGDGTEIVTDEGKLHLASVLDMASRRIVGFALDEHHDAELARAALAMAVAIRGGKDAIAGVIMHTDQGSEGGFNWSSQHPDCGGVDGQASGMDAGVDGQGADEVAGQAVASPRRGAVVLA
jgi:transposase InsO family protein